MNRAFVVAFLLCLPALSQERLHYVIPSTSFEPVSAQEQAAITAALCDGKADGTRCDTCPESTPEASGGFTLEHVVLGHFLSSSSRDAMVTVAGCEERHASIGWGFLLTRRAGAWESLQEMLGLDLRHCHPMRFRSGRELLVCETYDMESFVMLHGVAAVFTKGREIAFHNLLTAADTTRLCDSQTRLQKAEIGTVEFRDLNGDGVEDVSITASFGTTADSERRRRACEQSQDARNHVHRPEPKIMKPFRVDYLFDGRRFTVIKDSQAAVNLFRWEH